jgi:hypothetical protein
MPWKMDGEHIAMTDGKPVWVHPDGKEAPFDAEAALNKITSLNGESAARKTELRDAMDKLKVLDGIENPSDFMSQARKAMDTVKNLQDKQLIDAGDAEKVKEEIRKAMQGQIDDLKKNLSDKDAVLVREMIGGRFARSKFITDKLAIPADLVEARFGAAFKIEDGKVVAQDHHGNKLFSREKPGETADFDEALSMLVDAYPHKENILKGSGASGGGAQGGGGGHHAPGTISRTDGKGFLANLDKVASGAIKVV